MSLALKGTLVLVGAGKMGGAMLEGWLKSGANPKKIVVLDPFASDEMKALLVKHKVQLNPAIANIKNAEVILIAVKPQMMEEVLPTIVELGVSKPLILSVAAGKTIASFERHFGKSAAIIRTIPNTPASIGRGITAMSANANVSAAQLQLATQLLSAIGEVVTVDREELIDCVTAVSGSGPAYVFYMTECLAAAGGKNRPAPGPCHATGPRHRGRFRRIDAGDRRRSRNPSAECHLAQRHNPCSLAGSHGARWLAAAV